MRIGGFLLALVFVLAPAISHASSSHTCTSGPKSGTTCTTDADCTTAGVGGGVCEENAVVLDAGGTDLVVTSTTGRNLACGITGACATSSPNTCIAAVGGGTACRLTGASCSVDGDCKTCTGALDADGNYVSCSTTADCPTRSRLIISDDSLQYCGHDGLRYALQPRKFIHYRDSATTIEVTTSFIDVALDTTIPATLDSNFFSTTNPFIYVQKAGIYKVDITSVPRFTGRKWGKLTVRAEIDVASCAAADTVCTSCSHTDDSPTQGPDVTPLGTAGLYNGAQTSKHDDQDVGISVSSVVVLARCDRLHMSVRAEMKDDSKGKFTLQPNQSHVFMEYMGGDVND